MTFGQRRRRQYHQQANGSGTSTVQSKPKKIEVNYVHILYVVIEKREEKNGNVYFNVFHYLLYSNWFAFDFLHASDTLLLSATMARVFSTELLMCVFVCLSVCPSIRTYVGLYDWYFRRMLIRFYLLIFNFFLGLFNNFHFVCSW